MLLECQFLFLTLYVVKMFEFVHWICDINDKAVRYALNTGLSFRILDKRPIIPHFCCS